MTLHKGRRFLHLLLLDIKKPREEHYLLCTLYNNNNNNVCTTTTVSKSDKKCVNNNISYICTSYINSNNCLKSFIQPLGNYTAQKVVYLIRARILFWKIIFCKTLRYFV